jgi:hypothetical protein
MARPLLQQPLQVTGAPGAAGGMAVNGIIATCVNTLQDPPGLTCAPLR